MDEKRDENADYAMAAAVARFVELKDVRLVDLSAHVHVERERIFASSGWDLRFQRHLSCRFVDAGKLVIVDARLKTEVFSEVKDESKAELLVSFECQFMLDYWFPVVGGPQGDERERYFDAFANVNGVFNVWPYFREIVQATSARMSIPPIVLPVYRVQRTQSAPAVQTATADVVLAKKKSVSKKKTRAR